MRYPPGTAEQRQPMWLAHMLRQDWRCIGALAAGTSAIVGEASALVRTRELAVAPFADEAVVVGSLSMHLHEPNTTNGQ